MKSMVTRSIVLLALVCGFVAACGDDDDGNEDSASGGSPASEDTEPRSAPRSIVGELPSYDHGEQLEGTFVGASSDAGPYVATVLQGDETLAYVCDGDRLGDWFGGTVDGDRITAASDKGTSLEGSRQNGRLEGTVRLRDGGEHSFTLERPEGEFAGLYRNNGVDGAFAGTIVLPDGSRRGLLESKTLTISQSSGSTEPVVGDAATEGTTTTVGTTFVFSKLMRTNYTNCDQVRADMKFEIGLFGVGNWNDCGTNSQCKPFFNELNRVANRLGCTIDPFLTATSR